MGTEDIFFDVIRKDRETFFFYVRECNRLYRSGHDRDIYREIISLHREAGEANQVFSNDILFALIHEALVAWNMNERGARLVNVSCLRDSARKLRDYLLEAYEYKMYRANGRLSEDATFLLEKIFLALHVMDNKRRLVGVSKAMHFLLPDLVMPIDNQYTLTFFSGRHWNSDVPSKAFEAFLHIHRKAFRLVHELGISAADATGEEWNTSVPKLIDNAIIGFLKHHGL